MTAPALPETPLLDKANDLPLLERTQQWAAVNSGTTNLDGLKTVAGFLADAFSVLPGKIALVDPAPVDAVRPDGSVDQVQRGQHLYGAIRPDAPVRILLTGHMDTVFAASTLR